MPAACDSWKPGPWRPMWLRVAALPKCPRQHRRLRRSAGVFCPNQGLTHLLLGLAASYQRVMPGMQPCARMSTSARDPQNRPLSGCTSATIQPQTARARESIQPPLTRQGAHPMASLRPRVWPGIMPCSARALWNRADHAALVLPVGRLVCLSAHNLLGATSARRCLPTTPYQCSVPAAIAGELPASWADLRACSAELLGRISCAKLLSRTVSWGHGPSQRLMMNYMCLHGSACGGGC